MKINKSHLLAMLFLGGLAPAMSGQQESGGADSAFAEIIDVRVINLEVVVTDGKIRVPGLTANDFRVTVDGEEVPLEFLTEVRGGQAISAPAFSSVAGVPAVRPGKPVGTRYLVFIDEVFSLPTDRDRVLKALQEQLSYLRPEDSMAVVAFDGSQIEMLTSWTHLQNQLSRVIDEALERPTYGLYRRVDRRFDLAARSFHRRSRFPYYGTHLAAYYAGIPRSGRTWSRIESIVDAATSTLRAFARPSGRKVMILLSGGWPVGTYYQGSSFARVDYNGWRGRSVFEPLIDTANRLGYTLYPVDMKGVESHFGGAEFRSLREANFVREFRRESEWIQEGTLVRLAKETGGKAMLNGLHTKVIETIAEDTGSYYWLGFSPNWNWDDRRHRVQVEVLRKGLKSRSRRSFSDLSRQTEVTMMVESARLFDLPLPDEKQLGVRFGEPSDGGWKKVLVPLEIEIPLDMLTLLPTADGLVAQLELRIAATDDRNDRSDIPVIPIDIRLAEEPEPGDTLPHSSTLILRERSHSILVVLYDPLSGTSLSRRARLDL